MGAPACDSHAKGLGHIKKEQEKSKKGGGQSKLMLGPTGKVTASVKDSMNIPPEMHALRAEVIETLHKVEHNNISFNSSQNDGDRFRLIFPGHPAAEKYACSYTKSAHLVSHGIPAYFKQQLKEDCKNTPFTIKFDETTTSQIKKQFDMYICYWSKKYNLVMNKYVVSKFVGHCPATELLGHCNELMKEMGLVNSFLLHLWAQSQLEVPE